MTTLEIAKDKNKALEQRLLESIKKLPNDEIKSTCANDDAFNEQIINLSQSQKSNFKNLINEI